MLYIMRKIKVALQKNDPRACFRYEFIIFLVSTGSHLITHILFFSLIGIMLFDYEKKIIQRNYFV